MKAGRHRSLIFNARRLAILAALGLFSVLMRARVATPSMAAQTITVLHSFAGSPDGANPYSSLVRDSAGNLYGTTYFGGEGNGTVFKVNTSGTEQVLYSFDGDKDGSNPYAGLILDSSSNLYGTTVYTGGLNKGFGTVFRVTPSGTETVIHKFMYGDGAQPYGAVAFDPAGNLYGTTSFAGKRLFGTVYKLNRQGRSTVLYSFNGKGDGRNPFSGVVLDSSGSVYGTAPNGGSGYGIVFKVAGVNQESIFHKFAGWPNDGADPYAGLVRDAAGNLYGATYDGGVFNCGAVFELDPSGSETILYNFTGSPDGAYPNATLAMDARGNLFGTTEFGGATGNGTVFTLAQTGQETVLHSFSGLSDGANPMGGVIFDSVGNLYGTALAGGTSNLGVVFELKP